MILVDTSVWVEVLRGRGERVRGVLETALDGDEVVLTRFQQMELLQGARDEKEWTLLREYLDGQDYLEATNETWTAAARIFFDLRRGGKTVRSAIDCCIAQIAIEHDVLLLHHDRDFTTIAAITPLRQEWVSW